jgi:hypothetical protein
MPAKGAASAGVLRGCSRTGSCLAIEEVEVWMLALHRDLLDTPWTEVRDERDPKERFAQPFLSAHAPKLSPGGGRVWAMRELGAKWKGVLKVCPELAELEQTLQGWLSRQVRGQLTA